MKKLISGVLMLLMLAMVLAGCGAGQSNSGATTQAVDTHAPAKIVLKSLAHMESQAKIAGWKAVCDAYTQKNPNVTIQPEDLAYNNFLSAMKTRVAAGDAPDLIFGRPLNYTEMIDAGQLMSLDGTKIYDNLLPGVKDLVVYKGKPWGAPMDLGSFMVWYNKDVFQKAGITDVPKTFSDLMKACEAIKKIGVQPFGQTWKDFGNGSNAYLGLFEGGAWKKMHAVHPNLLDDLATRKLKWADIPEVKLTFDAFGKALAYTNSDAYNVDYNTSLANLATGKCGMYMQGTWAIGGIREANPQGHFGGFPFPVYDNPDDNMSNAFIDDGFMVSSTTKYKDDVIKFLEWMETPEAGAIWAKTSRSISCVAGVKLDNLDEMMNDVLSYNTSGKSSMGLSHLYSGERDQVFLKAIEDFIADNSHSTDKVIKELDSEFDRLAK